MSDIKHGRSGYRRGCHCTTCRAAHAQAQREYRAKRRAQERVEQQAQYDHLIAPEIHEPALADTKPHLDFDCAPGHIEEILNGELAKLIGEPPFKQTLLALARYNARILDQLPRLDRPDLASGIQNRLFNVFDRLRKVELAPGTDKFDLANILGDDLD